MRASIPKAKPLVLRFHLVEKVLLWGMWNTFLMELHLTECNYFSVLKGIYMNAKLHYITLHYITLRYITLHYINTTDQILTHHMTSQQIKHHIKNHIPCSVIPSHISPVVKIFASHRRQWHLNSWYHTKCLSPSWIVSYVLQIYPIVS